MPASYDEAGRYIGPDGFDPETGEWKPGSEDQRSEWEKQYAEAHARWEAHRTQLAEAAEAEANAPISADPAEGTLADDENLAALREQLNS
jgi:small subunit ribosomal protein S1